jgi:3-dehydroquinate dehydratase-2
LAALAQYNGQRKPGEREKPLAKARPIYVLNGPNLNLLGLREPEIYGRTRLSDIEAAVVARAATHKLDVTFRQSNHEGMLVDWIQEARSEASGLILNAGAFTHTSVAIHDALRALDRPVIEVHLSNPYARESFRHHSYVSPIATGVICGLKEQGYLLAVDALAKLLKDANA